MKTEEFGIFNSTSLMKLIHDCPFCGKKPEGGFSWSEDSKLFIKCRRCGIIMQRNNIGCDFDSIISNLYNLIDTWNGREEKQ